MFVNSRPTIGKQLNAIIFNAQKKKLDRILRFNRKIQINGDLFYVLEPFLIVTRIGGYSPIRWRKIGNYAYVLEESKFFSLYTMVLAHFLMLTAMSGLFTDLEAEDSIRMKNMAVKYVTMADLGEIVITVYVGMVTTVFRIKHFWRALDNLQEIDTVVRPISIKSERRHTIITICLFLCFVACVLIYESTVWGGISDEHGLLREWFLRYATLWTMYFLVHVQQLSYMQLTRLIKKRIETLNLYLEKIETDILHQDKNFIKSDIFKFERKLNTQTSGTTADKVIQAMKLFCFIHEATEATNDFCSVNILMILMSCLLHLVVTPYFFLVELTNEGYGYFILLQAVWTSLHATRLTLIVESCQRCITQYKITINLVGNLMTHHLENEVREQLKSFAIMLNFRKIEFTAFSLMTIDRSLLTTITGTCCTFLVILFQLGHVGSDVYFSRGTKND